MTNIECPGSKHSISDSPRVSSLVIFALVIPLAGPRLFGFIFGMANTQLTFYGHAAFKLVTPAGNVLLIDPWLTNPSFDKGNDELAALKRVDLILLTHGHGDHVGNAVEIGKRTGAKLVSTYDLAEDRKSVGEGKMGVLSVVRMIEREIITT